MRAILSGGLIAFAVVAIGGPPTPAKTPTRVSINTSYGRIVAVIFTDKAPITARNFLRYVDEGFYKNATFYRAVRPDNDVRFPKIKVIQGGIDLTGQHAPLPPIVHESTKATGLSHLNGALSAVRWDPGSAASEFFIVIDDTPELDFGGSRNPDGQGFAVFGRVVEGMDVVRRINASRTGKATTIDYLKDQALVEAMPIRIGRS
jgi:peptidyl-prolyl cis-trans isomerase A (cyclophilin A)